MNPSKIAAILCPLLMAAAALPVFAAGQADPALRAKVPVILDTDIGDDIDDAFALALVLSSPELDLRGVTTVHGDAYTRAMIVCRLLYLVGRNEVPVASGKPGQNPPELSGQFQYGLRPARKRPEKESAVDFLYRQLKARPGEITLLPVGPLTNIAALLAKYPDCKPWIKRIVLMGGSVRVGYENKPPIEPEWNIKADIKAAQAVFTSGVPLLVAPLDATTMLKLEAPMRKRIFTCGSPLTTQLHALYQLWDKPTPTLFDPVAVMLCFDEKLCKIEDLHLEVDDKGFTRIGKGKANARVAMSIRADDFLKWFVERLAPESAVTPLTKLKETNVSKPVERGRMPNRVHAFEDYETEIERRWWLAGLPETKNLPPESTRACRGVLTNDFDGQMGDPKGMYTAVIFNPVPGPPMGPNTRLSFRYWLKGTSNLRVQIYTLTNGYHRHLTLTGLPQEKWQSAAVDMTAVRRPDGSGGPLSENERIDDIQFYTDAAAELFIDDIVLYDAAAPEEKRPFPRRLLFTGVFDTGQQGKEWPGTFDIVPKKPLPWKAAKSVPNADLGVPWIRLHLRGERPLGEATQLSFRYHLNGADTMKVLLVNRTQKDTHAIELKGLKKDQWAETVLDFTSDSKRGDGSAGKPKKGDRVDEIHFLLPKGTELLLDDVLLYESAGEAKR